VNIFCHKKEIAGNADQEPTSADYAGNLLSKAKNCRRDSSMVASMPLNLSDSSAALHDPLIVRRAAT